MYLYIKQLIKSKILDIIHIFIDKLTHKRIT